MQAKQPRGYVIYKGPSLLDGKPIVAIAITAKAGNDANRKTGDIVQTYILADNGVRPTVNLQTGDDSTVCGDCKHRPFNGGACYVVVAQGPTQVWKSFTAGKYAHVHPALVSEMIAGRMVRLGTYGDPAAVPAHVWMALITHAPKHSGYTHQWRNAALGGGQLEGLRILCMASCDTPEERDIARSQGWRTFTVRTADEPLAERESACPASEEAGKKVTCAQCAMCDGDSGKRGSIAIIAHGYRARRYIALRAA